MASIQDYMAMGTFGKPKSDPNNFGFTAPDWMPNNNQMPEQFSAKPGFDWGGATKLGTPEWSNGYGFTGTGGFDGSGVAAPKNWWDGAFGTTDAKGMKTDGWAGTALGVAGGLAKTYLGLEQLDIAKATLSENKRQFEMNYGARKGTTNTALEDQARGRSGATDASVSAYMAKNGVK